MYNAIVTFHVDFGSFLHIFPLSNFLCLLSRGTAKLVCALLLKYYYSTVGYDVICFVMGSLVIDRLGQYRMGKYWR